MNNQWSRLFAYFFVISVLTTAVIAVPSIGDGQWMPDSIAAESRTIDGLYWGLVVLSVVILAIVSAVIIYSLVHFKAGRGDEADGAPIHGNHRLEIFWTVIPTIIVIVVGVVSYVILVDNERAIAKGKSQPVVQVRAFSFGWAFRYGEREALKENAPVEMLWDDLQTGDVKEKDVAWGYDWHELSDGEAEAPVAESSNLVLPRGRPVMFEVISCSRREPADSRCGKRYGEPLDTAAAGERRDEDLIDVNHAFWVPEARMKIDAVAGLPTWTQFTPNELTRPDDVYQVVCAELCGSGHNGMRVDMCVVDDATHKWWRSNALTTCQVLRYFNCEELGQLSDRRRSELRTEIEGYISEHPEADCGDIDEELAA